MPKVSEKSKLLECVTYVGIEAMLNDNSLLEDEDIAFIHFIVESQRYCTPRIPKPISEGIKWWKTAVLGRSYSAEMFKCHFRMSQEMFWELCNEINGSSIFNDMQQPVFLQLAVALYRFGSSGNAASSRQIAAKFDIAEGSVFNFTDRVIGALIKIQKKFIAWPSKDERKLISDCMATRGLPKCVGFVDGTDIPFSESPTENKEVYWSRKKKYCMQLQIICDPDKKIRDVFTGYPGSVHDAKVFSNSPIGLDPTKFFSSGEYLIGDSAYAMTEHMVVPFRRIQGGLTRDQSRFNRHISSERVKVEHTIGMLKCRFQSLTELRITVNKSSGHRKVCEWILACIVLHNFLMQKESWEVGHVRDEIDDAGFCQYRMEQPNRKGYFKRQALLNIFRTLYL